MEKEMICPICGKYYSSRPAISRIDNETEICPVCGTREALEAFGKDSEEARTIAEIIHNMPGVKI